MEESEKFEQTAPLVQDLCDAKSVEYGSYYLKIIAPFGYDALKVWVDYRDLSFSMDESPEQLAKIIVDELVLDDEFWSEAIRDEIVAQGVDLYFLRDKLRQLDKLLSRG